MSKIICDICGTSYPDTATQCPICGTAAVNNEAASAAEVENARKNDKKRGGRFSKNNVVKRSMEPVSTPKKVESFENEPKKPGGNRIVALIVVLLLIAVMFVFAYIFVRLMLPDLFNPADPTEPSTSLNGDPTNPARIPCTGLTVAGEDVVEFDMPGRAWLLNVTVEPMDTTDEIIFESDDETVATVSASGRVVSVSAGVAKITVRCGDMVKEITIECNFENEAPTDPDKPDDPTDPPVNFELVDHEFTLSDKNGLSWKIRWSPASVNATDITWTSSNTSVASVKDGLVTAHKTGTATITAEYQGKKFTCVVHCSVANPTTPPDGGGSSTSGVYTIQVNGITPAYGNKLNKADCTFSLSKKSFRLTVVDKNGNGEKKVLDWKVKNESICTIKDDGKGNVTVTLLKKGYTSITAEYEGVKYEIIVRVS